MRRFLKKYENKLKRVHDQAALLHLPHDLFSTPSKSFCHRPKSSRDISIFVSLSHLHQAVAVGPSPRPHPILLLS